MNSWNWIWWIHFQLKSILLRVTSIVRWSKTTSIVCQVPFVFAVVVVVVVAPPPPPWLLLLSSLLLLLFKRCSHEAGHMSNPPGALRWASLSKDGLPYSSNMEDISHIWWLCTCNEILVIYIFIYLFIYLFTYLCECRLYIPFILWKIRHIHTW